MTNQGQTLFRMTNYIVRAQLKDGNCLKKYRNLDENYMNIYEGRKWLKINKNYIKNINKELGCLMCDMSLQEKVKQESKETFANATLCELNFG